MWSANLVNVLTHIMPSCLPLPTLWRSDVLVCVCVCVGERASESKSEREREEEGERERERGGAREGERERVSEKATILNKRRCLFTLTLSMHHRPGI
jgi:hypothetical protein